MTTAHTIITLDGPAGVGKSTLARLVANAVCLPYLDTGAMFRVLALRLGPDADLLSPSDLRARCMAFSFQLKGIGERSILLCNHEALGDAIRTEEIAQRASHLAALTTVRDYLKEAQRILGETTSLVVEGRDMGTVIFPTARHKFFLDATPEVRAQRRFDELVAKGETPELATITAMIKERDHLDRNRPVAPLKPADDAHILDTSYLDIESVLRAIIAAIHQKDALSVQTLTTNSATQNTTISELAFSHLDNDGSVTMVDVGAKDITERVAIVRAVVELNATTLDLLKRQALPKGDVLVTAKLAGIMAAKRTSELIPLCHPVPLTYADVRFQVVHTPPSILIEAEARTRDRTGIEMEALIAAQVAAATIYDMCKAVQKDIVIRDARLVFKSGGRSGIFDRRRLGGPLNAGTPNETMRDENAQDENVQGENVQGDAPSSKHLFNESRLSGFTR